MALGLENVIAKGNIQGGPKHQRLEKHLLRELSAGRLQPGQALPTEVEMANMLGVARNTVRQALASLEQDGLVQRIRGKGTFVHEEAHQRLAVGSDVLGAFGLVLPEIHSGFYPSLQRGFGEAAAKTHNQMLVCNTGNDLHRQGDAILQLLDTKVAGVAIVPATAAPTPAYHIRTLQKNRIPVVFCHRGVEGVAAPLVTYSGVEVGRIAGKKLAALGHQRVAYIATQKTSMAEAYLAGLRESLGQGNGSVPERFTYFGTLSSIQIDDKHEQEMQHVLERFFADPNPPTAIMTSFDSYAEMIYLLLGRLGLRAPEDVSLVGFGGAYRSGAILHKLTSVVVDEAKLGARAVELINEIHNGKRDIRDDFHATMPVSLSPGQTLGPASTLRCSP